MAIISDHFYGESIHPWVTSTDYVMIEASASDITDGDEGGKLNFKVQAGGTAGSAGFQQLLTIGGEDVAATLDYTEADNTLQGISVTGFKMDFKKADGTLTTFNIFQQMMLFSLFQGHFVSRAIFNAHQHTEAQPITFDNDIKVPSGTTSVPI